MERLRNQSGVENSVVYKLFGKRAAKNDNKNHIKFMNDNYFAKRLSENVVEAKLIDLRGVDCKSLGKTVDRICLSEIASGTNVQFAEGQVCERDALNLKEGHIMTENAIRRARSTLVKAHTNKIDGYYILLVHPDIADRLIKEKHFSCMQDPSVEDVFNMALVGEINDILIIETYMIPIIENSMSEKIYQSFLLGECAFGVKYLKAESTLGIKIINETHLVRIETIG